MVEEARPSILGGVSNHLGAKWVGLDVPQNHQQMHVILNHGALKPALPDMT
jgi:hypothetical protein